jgi:hypothetical protein
MSKKRWGGEMQAQAWLLQLSPRGVDGRAQHEALIDRLGLNPAGDGSGPMSFGRIRHRAATVAAQQCAGQVFLGSGADLEGVDGRSQRPEEGRGA